MGMYTELVLNVTIKRDAPADVIRTLSEMAMGSGVTTPAVGHPFFKTDRWSFMLAYRSFYFIPIASTRFEKVQSNYYLSVRCDLKNYSSEIELFIEWLTPFIDAMDGDFLGYKRCEEDDKPSLLYHPNIWAPA